MKKNLLSILILALLIVNIALSVITMISVTSTNKATASLVGSIATAIHLELDDQEEEQPEEVVSMADTEVHDIPDSLTIPLKPDADGKEHYAVVTASFAVNIKDKDYKTYGASIDSKISLIKGEINDVFGRYTKDEAMANQESIEKEVLERIQSMFDSKFIYKVVLNEVYQ